MRSWAIGFTVLVFAAPAYAQEEAKASTDDVFASPTGNPSGRFAAPNGQLGAGLSLSPEQRGRAFIEVGFGRLSQSESIFGAEVNIHVTTLSFILGGGFKVLPNLELDAMLPLGWTDYGVTVSQPGFPTDSQGSSGLALANLHVGASYLYGKDRLRLKAGGAVEYGPWSEDPSDEATVATAYAYAARGGQDAGLWAPEVFTVVAPARVEYGDRLVLGGDAALGVHVPTNGADVVVSVQLDPSVGFYALDTVLVGLRVPFAWLPTESGSGATYLATEPYARFDLGPGFISTRFTLNIDKPLGFSFDEGKIWGAHIGGGGSF